jgi:hypothetical protein
VASFISSQKERVFNRFSYQTISSILSSMARTIFVEMLGVTHSYRYLGLLKGMTIASRLLSAPLHHTFDAIHIWMKKQGCFSYSMRIDKKHSMILPLECCRIQSDAPMVFPQAIQLLKEDTTPSHQLCGRACML